MPFVELPLGATEDRLVGTLDFERALGEGRRGFRPGLLAAANRGILCVDEVNLLADHLVDVLLDAAVSGIDVIQRVPTLVLDTDSGFIRLGRARELARALRSEYLPLEDLTADSLTLVIQERRRSATPAFEIGMTDR